MATSLENYAAMLRKTGRATEARKMGARAKSIRPLIEGPLMADSDLTATSDLRPECPYFWHRCLP